MLSTFKTVTALDRIFDDVMGSNLGAATSARSFSPSIDVRSSESAVTLFCDLPGVKKEDVEMTLANHVLTLKGTRRYDAEEGEHVVLGRAYGSFVRTFALPDALDEGNVSAHLRDGVLTITIPKHPRAVPRKIAIGEDETTKQIGG